jgi:flagellar biogenesis protein FliO
MIAFWLQAANPAQDIGSINSELLSYFKLIVVLGLILVLVFVGLRYGLPRMSGMRQFSSGPIRVVARYPLEPRKTLYIVRTGGGYYLVGTSESGVHFLTALDSGSVEAALLDEPATDTDFGGLMKAFRRSKRSL